MNKEITIEVRNEGQISIQGAGVQDRQEEIKALLQDALKAMENKPDEQFRNELIYKP